MNRIKITAAAICFLLTACAAPQPSAPTVPPAAANAAVSAISIAATSPRADAGSAADADLPETVLASYYSAQDTPIFEYLQNNSIQSFLNMWFEEKIDQHARPHWNYDTLTQVQLMDHDFESLSRAGEQLYTMTFSIDDGRCGYIIIVYHEDGPAISEWSLHETTPDLYDLRANREAIATALSGTDIDLSTAAAARVEWIDTAKRRGDRIILFTDGKGDRYVCYLGDHDFTIEKKQPLQVAARL